MKILVSDYSSGHSTEPLYLSTVFNTIGCSSTLWENNISTFDMFDMAKPDLHVTHHTMLTRDLVFYLQNAKVDLIINITGINQQQLTALDQIFSEHGIKPAFYFINRYDHKLNSKTNIVPILHGADLFLGKTPPQYDIDYGIFVNDKSEMNPIGETYHYITNNEELTNDVDIYLPVHRLNNLYGNYKNIVIKNFNGEMPQLFFDAAFYHGKVFFDVKDRSNLNDCLKKIFHEEGRCDLSDMNSGEIRDSILKKHTCLHRAKSLLSQIPCKDYLDNLQQVIEKSLS